jgi:hypothetical protein
VSSGGGFATNSLLNIDGCGNGASGTIFYKNESILIINNDGKPTTQRTIIDAPESKTSSSVIARSVMIEGGSLVLINSNQNTELAFEELLMSDDTELAFTTQRFDPFSIILSD